MAEITSYAIVSPSSVQAQCDNTIGLDSFAKLHLSPPVAPTNIPKPSFGQVTDNSPIQELQNVVTAYRAPSFLNDFYYRVHINPSALDLGNMLSSQSKTVEVWSAYFEPNLLSSLDSTGAEGITLTQPEVPPTYFAALESRLYGLNISTNGPPVIAATFAFNFQSGANNLTIIGKRVVLWPFVPEQEFEETLTWNTDILPSYNSEQRIAIRQAPRQAFEHDFLLTQDQFSRAKAIAKQWSHRVFGIPVWSEILPIANLSAGATTIPVDTTKADYRAGDLIVLWASDINLAALEILNVYPTYIELKVPLTKAWPKAYIAPLRFARTYEGFDFTRQANEYIGAKAKFDVLYNKDLGDESTLTTYRGKTVLLDRSAVVGNLSERIARTIDVFDNGSAIVQVDTINNWTRHVQTVSFIKNNRTDIWALRKWLHARKGKQKSFWLPSWNKDITILENVANTAASLTVSPIGYPLYYDVRDIMIQLKNGSRIFTRVTSGATNGDGNEILSLAAQVGTTFTTADVSFVCFMTHVRFDTDEITLTHKDAFTINTSLNVVEVPE